MRLDFNSLKRLVRPDNVIEGPTLGGSFDAPLQPNIRRQMRAPAVSGLVVLVVFFVGFGIWATTAEIAGAVTAPGVVKVEANKKTLKSRDGGVIREINVKEGDRVTPDKTLIKFDDSNLVTQIAIFQNQLNTLMMQSARLQAEVIGENIVIPPELEASIDQPAVAAIINIERTVFQARKTAYEGQLSILNQRISQLNSLKAGLDIQSSSLEDQLRFQREELRGTRAVFEQGFASKAIVNRLQRQISETQGRKGQVIAEMSRNRQQVGEAQLQAANLLQQRASEAATLRTEVETKIVDLKSRLKAARDALELTEVKSPVEGYVFGLSQFTIGGVAAPSERLMEVVPSDASLVIEVQVRPNDIDQIRVGLETKVTLQAYSSSKVPPLDSEVLSISPDAMVSANGVPYYVAMVRILPREIRKLGGVRQPVPGMQATVMIKTGRRTFLSYIIQPIRENLGRSLREE
jgi:HlyD family type I secretion membrane fusion protein